MSRPAVLAVVLAVIVGQEVSGFGFQLPNETIEAETYTVNEEDLEQMFEINQRGAIFDSVTGKRRYDNYQLIRVNPQTDEHLDVLQFLDRGQGMVEMWSTIPYNASLVDAVEMVVSPRHEKHVKDYLSCSGMTPAVIEDNLQRAMDIENEIDPEDEEGEVSMLDLTRRGHETISHPPLAHVVQKRGTFGDLLRGFLTESPSPTSYRQGRQIPPVNFPTVPKPQTTSIPDRCAHTGMTWNKYHRYNTIDNFVKCLATEYPDKAERFLIGHSYEGKKLNLLRISNNLRVAKKAVWIDGGIHAREWVSPSAVTYLMHELLQNSHLYSDILNEYDLFILPLANPDGYEYSHKKDRLWRKTRSRHRGNGCVGVDPNRNWGYHWAGQGASGDPCDETYYGPKAFSEPETDAIQKFIMARKHNMKLYLTFHSYGQYILYPWGYARRDTPDKKDLHNVGLAGARAVRALSGRKYSVGTAAKMLYPAAGGSDDWAKGSAGIKYSYTIELPDSGRYGFILPASKAKGVVQEAVALTKAMISSLR